MKPETAPSLKLLRIYKRILHDFKLVWSVKHHYEILLASIEEEALKTPPVDLNRIYGTLKVVYDGFAQLDSTIIINRLERVAYDLVTIFEWFSQLDERISAYGLRIYLERETEVGTKELRALAKYFLHKPSLNTEDIAKADYLLTRAFSYIDNTNSVKINIEPAEKLEAEIARLLPQQWRRRKPPQYLLSLAQINSFLKQLEQISSYDKLIASDIIAAAREFKSNLQENFYSAEVLSRCVQFNVELRNRFERFCHEENELLKNYSLALIGAGAHSVKDWFDTRQRIRLTDALKFSRNAPQLLSHDYGQTRAYLEQLSRVRDLLQRSLMVHGIDPHDLPPSPVGATTKLLDDTEFTEQEIKTLPYLKDANVAARLRSLTEAVYALELAIQPSNIKVLHLNHTTLMLSAWELDAFRCPPPDNFFARLNMETLKCSLALLAEIRENLALSRLYRDNPELANTYLMRVNFYSSQAQRVAEDLEKLSNLAREHNEIDLACNLSATQQKLLDSCSVIELPEQPAEMEKSEVVV